MRWELAPALKSLRISYNLLDSNRDKTSDGTIGDSAHSARKSDHNPRVVPPGNQAYVMAFDGTHDPPKVDNRKLFESVLKDSRTKFAISHRVIGPPKRPYGGPNPHISHMHTSAKDSARDDARMWFTDLLPPVQPDPGGDMLTQQDIDTIRGLIQQEVVKIVASQSYPFTGGRLGEVRPGETKVFVVTGGATVHFGVFDQAPFESGWQDRNGIESLQAHFVNRNGIIDQNPDPGVVVPEDKYGLAIRNNSLLETIQLTVYFPDEKPNS